MHDAAVVCLVQINCTRGTLKTCTWLLQTAAFSIGYVQALPTTLACAHTLQGEPSETIPRLVSDVGAGLLVTDYSPLRLGRTWRTQVGPVCVLGLWLVGGSDAGLGLLSVACC